MAVPDFQTMMLPLLRLCNDSEEHSVNEAYDRLALEFQLSAEDREELLPSGRQTRFENRVQWAKTHLTKAGAITKCGRGVFRITDRGRALVQDGHQRITMATLFRFPEFQEFRARAKADQKPSTAQPAPVDDTLTPREQMDSCYQVLRQALAEELLDRIMDQTPAFFEQLVVDLLVGMGYGGSRDDAARAMQRSNDQGVDGEIKEDRLGLDAVYVQAKKWTDSVGRPVVQAFAGSLMGLKARKGVLITTSTFTKGAEEYARMVQERNIVLIDGERLAQLMIDHGIGVSEVRSYVVKQVDTDYFDAF